MFDPENPTRVPCEINRPNRKAGAAAIAKLTNGKFVCAVWREVDRKPKGRIDFYVSKSAEIRDGFEEKHNGAEGESKSVTWNYGDLDDSEGVRDPQYQCINFIEPIDNDAGDGITRLFMIGAENSALAAPIQGGDDFVDLFEVLIPNDMLISSSRKPVLRKIQTKKFFCRNREYYNFDAAGGIYVDHNEGLYLYSGYHWRVNETIRFAEFRSTPDPASVIDDIQKAWIDLFEEPKFGGRRLSILGEKESGIADYGKIFVQGGDFNDKVSSVKYQIPSGYVYRLYKDKAFKGNRLGEDFLELVGTGRVKMTEDFRAESEKFENKISSSRFI